MICAREGCSRVARRDEFCGTFCAKLHYGLIEFDPDASRKRRNRKAAINKLRREHGSAVTVENADALDRRLPGSFESGKRR